MTGTSYHLLEAISRNWLPTSNLVGVTEANPKVTVNLKLSSQTWRKLLQA